MRLTDETLAELERHVAGGYVRVTHHPAYPLRLYVYTHAAQYEGAWDPVSRMARGLIVDDEHNVIARPFDKFFNWGEWDDDKRAAYARVMDDEAWITPKLDGSLGILYRFDDRWHVATKGSFSSEQAQVANTMLDQGMLADVPDGVTPMVEIIYPENRIVVNYGDDRGLVFLAARDIDSGAVDYGAEWWTGDRVPRVSADRMWYEVYAMPPPNTEGFVVSFSDGEMVKFKNAEYLRLHRIVTGLNERSVWEALRDESLGNSPDGEFDKMLERVPDEFYAWVDGVREKITAQWQAHRAEVTGRFQRLSALLTTSRKAYALAVMQEPTHLRGMLFALADGKNIDQALWDSVRPKATEPFRQEV